jgi:hypothetical protein
VVCLEVTVNRERYCVAARKDAHKLRASILHYLNRHEPDHVTGFLWVHGWSAFMTQLEWGGAGRRLAAGDTVTLRVLNADRADAPERSQRGSSVDDDGSEPAFRSGNRLANDPLNFFANDTSRYMMFWVSITILGLIAWFLRSH